MQSDIEKHAQMLYDNINFKDRNRPSPYRLYDEIAKHQTKDVDNMYSRNKWLESQKRNNYINEYERLLSISKSGLPQHTLTIEKINLRLGKLKDLAKQSVMGDKYHEIYNKKRHEEMTDQEKVDEANKKLKEARQSGASVPRIHNTAFITQPNSTNEFYI